MANTTRRGVKARPARTDKVQLAELMPPRRFYTTRVRAEEHDEETTVSVPVRSVVAEVFTRRSRTPRITVLLEDPINHGDLELGSKYLSINLETESNCDRSEIAVFVQPECIVALAECLNEAIATARAQGIIPHAQSATTS